MIKAYRKTATIKAEKFDGSNEMVDKYNIEVVEGDYADDYGMPEAGPAPYFRYFMPSGYNEIYAGDWVATGINGKHWEISDDVFKKTYAELPVIPENVAEYIEHTKSIDCDIWDAMHYFRRPDNIDEYMQDNSETFARAWLDGYTVEEEK